MKKVIILYIWLITLLFIYIFLYVRNQNIVNEIKNDGEFFNNLKLLDKSGNVILNSFEEKYDRLEKEMMTTFHESAIDINNYKKFLSSSYINNGEEREKIKELIDEIEKLKIEKDNKNTEYSILNLSIQHANDNNISNKNDSYFIEGVPKINQYPRYPTGCESVALTILLRYHGINVSTDDIIKRLKQGPQPYKENNIIYGGNPELEFIGSPYSYDSYGVYNDPIGNVAAEFSDSVNVQTNFPFSEVLSLIREGKPVMVWTSMNLALPYLSGSWIYKPTGEKITWKAQEHAVVMLGYNKDYVIISDPLRGEYRYQDRTTFESRYNYYGRRAVYLW